MVTKKIHRLSDLKDRLGFTILAAPDEFPHLGSFGVDQKANLLIAFEILEQGFPLLEKKLKDPAAVTQLRQSLQEALLAYQEGDVRRGSHLLQAFQATVFPNRLNEYARRKGLDEVSSEPNDS